MTTRETLLIAIYSLFLLTPAYSGPPEDLALFAQGEKAVWDSSGHPKANGVKMTIAYPHTWAAKEGNRPHMVQNLISDSGKGLEMAMIQIRPLPEPYNRQLTDEEKQELVSRDIASQLASAGTLLSYKKTKIDGEPCAMLETEQISERAGLTIGQKMLIFLVPLKGSLLIVQCSAASNSLEEARKRYEMARPLFLLIGASCVVLREFPWAGLEAVVWS